MKYELWRLSVILLLIVSGCGTSTSSTPLGQPSTQGKAFLLENDPTSFLAVKDARDKAVDQEEIIVEGRIGGEAVPWVKGQAAFLIVDKSLKPCNETADDACETPWDYCCDTDQLPSHKIMVKIVDNSGMTVAEDARSLLGVKELQTVMVKGKAKRDSSGNLTLLATGIFIRK